MSEDLRRKNDERRAAIEAKRKRLEDLRKSKTTTSKQSSTTTKSTDVIKSTKTEDSSSLNNLIEELLQEPPKDQSSTVQTLHNSPDITSTVETPKKTITLSRSSNIGSFNMGGQEYISYSKSTQTDVDYVTATVPDNIPSPKNFSRKSLEPMEINSNAAGSKHKEDSGKSLEISGYPAQLEEDELLVIEKDKSFQSFMAQGVRVLERAMKQNTLFDVAIDYGGMERQVSDNMERATLLETLSDPRWGQNRTLTDIKFSPHHKELFLTSYSKPHETDESMWSKDRSANPGLLLVWSMHMLKEGPEYTFYNDSPIETAQFHPLSPNIIIGGTYSGQIVMWDLKSSSIPVQRSMMTVESHAYPVYCMTVTGSGNATNMISLSTDGQLCLWSLQNIATPSDSKSLRHKKKDFPVTAMAFAPGEVNEMVIGTEDGRIAKVQVHGSRAGVQSQIEAHQGPITRLQFHRSSTSTNDLLISCSLDWRIKLWSLRTSESPILTLGACSDYVYDVQWSPCHPAVFASVDGAGMLDIWNLNIDTETPYARISVNNGETALSRLCWTSDGKKIFVGDSRGSLFIYEVTSDIYSPRKDEASIFENNIAHIIENQL